jgi:hypothetical protein
MGDIKNIEKNPLKRAKVMRWKRLCIKRRAPWVAMMPTGLHSAVEGMKERLALLDRHTVLRSEDSELRPPVPVAALLRVELPVDEWNCAKDFQNLFTKEGLARIELCVTSDCILLKVGLSGVTYKHAGILAQPMRAEVSKVGSDGRVYHADGEAPFRIFFTLEGSWTNPWLKCYRSPLAKPSETTRNGDDQAGAPSKLVFNFRFELCDVWRNERWFVHEVTPFGGVFWEPPHTAGEWNIWCEKIGLHLFGPSGQMDLYYADGTKVRWIIAEEGAGQFAFRASSNDGSITLDCRVRVEDYNRIRLHISTHNSAPVDGIPLKKSTVEYTLVR